MTVPEVAVEVAMPVPVEVVAMSPVPVAVAPAAAANLLDQRLCADGRLRACSAGK